MKKLVIFVLCAVCMAGLVGCSTKTDDDLTFEYGLTKDGYYQDITAQDYVTLPETFDVDLDIDVSSMVATDIEYIYSTYGTKTELDGPAENGNVVNITYVGSVDGVIFQGGSTDDAGDDLTLGAGLYIDGFEDQIVGHLIGDTFNIVVTFPENYGTSYDDAGNIVELSGKEAVFTTTLNNIYDITISDEDVATIFNNFSVKFADGTEVKTVEDMKRYFEETELDYYTSEAVHSYLINNSVISEIPEKIIDIEKNRYRLNTLFSMRAQGVVSFDDYLKGLGYDSWDAYLEASMDQITSTAKSLLIYQAAAEKFGIIATTDDIKNIFNENYDVYVSTYTEPYMKQLALEDLVITHIIEIN